MRYKNKNLVIGFVGVIAVLLFVNRWIAREIKNLAHNLPAEKYSAPRAVEKTRQTAAGPRPVIIDPLNDPLSPVIPRKQPKSSAKTVAPRRPSQEKIYEPSVENVMLVQ